MKITGFLPESFQDWDGGLCSVVFIGRCNCRCPTCHAAGLLNTSRIYSEERILRKIGKRKSIIQRLVVTGGEATQDPDLINFLRKVKKLGIEVKLDTNGTNPDKLYEILNEGLASYVALDIKGPRELYPLLTGVGFDVSNVEKSLDITQRFRGYELRTTVVPVPDKTGKIDWLSPEQALDMVNWIRPRILNLRGNRHYLQPFVAREEKDMMDATYAKDKLPLKLKATPYEIMENMKAIAIKEGYKFIVRN